MAGRDCKTFLDKLDSNLWKEVFWQYEDVLNRKAELKSKSKSGKDLMQYDKWYQETLPSLIESRPCKLIKHEDIVQLMKWKLSRGKFRPRLVDLAASNSPDDVEKLSQKAFMLVDSSNGNPMKNIQQGIEALSKLKGIGPATASAILTAGCPNQVAFMADEPTYMALSTTSLKYSLAEYMSFVEKIRNIAEQLEHKDAEFDWTPHKVELTMWTYSVGKVLGMDVTQPKTTVKAKTGRAKSTISTKQGNKRKKSSNSTNEDSSLERKGKKRKMDK